MSDPVVVPPAKDRWFDTSTLLACVVCGLFGGTLYVLAFHDIPANNKDVLLTLAGLLGTGFSGLVQYYFGSSASSRTKDTTITALTKGP